MPDKERQLRDAIVKEVEMGCCKRSLGVVKMPPGYALMSTRDLRYYWLRYDDKCSNLLLDRWEIYRQAKENWAKEEIIKLKGEEMNQTKIDKLWRNQSSTAKKIYGSVPKQTTWTSAQILADLKRLGSSMAKKNVEGCLHSLHDDGLITVVGGQWRQIVPSLTTKKEAEVTIVERAPEKTNDEPRSPIDVLAEMVTKVQDLMASFENAALEITEYIEDVEIKAQKMKQLQQLLQSIGT